jgi:5-formyltetrahydrofolate cyclo-ligase
MNSAELKRAKRSLRREILAARDALPEGDRTRAAAEIERRAVREMERSAAAAAMVFWSFGSEVATAEMIRALHDLGLVVALPRIVGEELQARTYRPGEPVTETSFGAREPAGGRILDPREIDVVVVPGVAFDRGGYRVGYGGGYYDRFLPRTRADARRLSVAFGLQVVDRVPHGSFDLPVHTIVTESETVRCSSSALPDDAASTAGEHPT